MPTKAELEDENARLEEAIDNMIAVAEREYDNYRTEEAQKTLEELCIISGRSSKTFAQTWRLTYTIYVDVAVTGDDLRDDHAYIHPRLEERCSCGCGRSTCSKNKGPSVTYDWEAAAVEKFSDLPANQIKDALWKAWESGMVDYEDGYQRDDL